MLISVAVCSLSHPLSVAVSSLSSQAAQIAGASAQTHAATTKRCRDESRSPFSRAQFGHGAPQPAMLRTVSATRDDTKMRVLSPLSRAAVCSPAVSFAIAPAQSEAQSARVCDLLARVACVLLCSLALPLCTASDTFSVCVYEQSQPLARVVRVVVCVQKHTHAAFAARDANETAALCCLTESALSMQLQQQKQTNKTNKM